MFLVYVVYIYIFYIIVLFVFYYSSEPGSPTLGEAILMGCQDVNPITHDVGANKITDAVTLANLVVSRGWKGD